MSVCTPLSVIAHSFYYNTHNHEGSYKHAGVHHGASQAVTATLTVTSVLYLCFIERIYTCTNCKYIKR